MTGTPLPATSRTDFQRLLTRIAAGDLAITADDAAALLGYQVALNAVLEQSLRAFFARGATADTPEDAALALALHAADPGKFRFPGCDNCTSPALCGCPERRAWLDACRLKVRTGGKLNANGQVT